MLLGFRGDLALFGHFVFGAGPEALELVEGSVERALDAGFIAGQDGERVGVTDVAEEDGGEAVEAGEAPALVVKAAGVFGQAELDGGGFHTTDAAEAPGGHDDLLDEEDFDGAEGLVMLFVRLGDFLELVFVFEREDGVLGGESMFEGIEANGGLARGGLGTSGVEGVGAVGVNLFLGGHSGRSLRN